MRHIVQAYHDRHPACLRWQYRCGSGLWAAYPAFIQQQIVLARLRGADRITVDLDHVSTVLDLSTLRQHQGTTVQTMQCHMQTMCQYKVGEGDWAVTSDMTDVPDGGWGEAFVGLTSGALVIAAPDAASLRLLIHLCAVDPSLWQPACKDESCRAVDPSLGQAVGEDEGCRALKPDPPVFNEVLEEFLASMFEVLSTPPVMPMPVPVPVPVPIPCFPWPRICPPPQCGEFPVGAIASAGTGQRKAGRVHPNNERQPPKRRRVHLWEELGLEEMPSEYAESGSAGNSCGLDSDSALSFSSLTTEERSGASFSTDVSDSRRQRGRNDSESGGLSSAQM